MPDRSTGGDRPLEGERLDTATGADARHWISIYSDLVSFKIGLLDRVRRDLQKLNPIAQKAARVDLVMIEQQLAGYHGRIRLWYQRLWDLQGLWLDSDTRMVRHGEKYLTLTKREFQLLSFLLAHPNRFFTSAQIVGQAWADRALSPEEVRNYVLRLRKVLVELAIPCDLVNRPGRGYSLIFRPEEDEAP
ncbi:MAG TPA: winged helix-turn-helix domain-containing protein [Candidatus Dormibacteraeota bacterium]|jgi:DNA-binding response OmpR family regulator